MPLAEGDLKNTVLKRLSLDDSWKGIHTHFSLNRGIPQQSYGKIKGKS